MSIAAVEVLKMVLPFLFGIPCDICFTLMFCFSDTVHKMSSKTVETRQDKRLFAHGRGVYQESGASEASG